MENKMKPIPLEDLVGLLRATHEKKPIETPSAVTELTQGTPTGVGMRLPLEALQLLSVPTPEETLEPSESRTGRGEDMEQPLLPLEAFKALANSLAKKNTETSSETTSPNTNHIVDLTDQYSGKSLIISGVKKP